MKNLLTRKPLYLAAIMVVLTGCAQKPRQVEAQLALVDKPKIELGEALPEKYWPALNSPETTQVSADGMPIEIGKPYTSGLGIKCRALQFSVDPNENRTRIACSQLETRSNGSSQKQWYLTDNIVETSTVIKIQ